jgi:DNA-directed RNA polymerase specialized sigma24 family protein
MPSDSEARVIAQAAIADAASLTPLGEILRVALAQSPLCTTLGVEAIDDPRITAIRVALAYAVAQIDALALPLPPDHADDILRGLGMTRAEIATALGITDDAVKKRRSRRSRRSRRM